jgi:tetratricopeptide (TPR) repeat protein
MSDKRTCFVISPIGEKDSDTRKRSDDLYDLIVQPALEKYDFEIVRADKLSSVASITTEIVELVQDSDLCVIDITGHNPNVMYECGRRHETGKPYIMVAQEKEKLPFDINTIRTVFYSTATGREIRAVVVQIQAIVEKMIADGFRAQSSGESLSSIADALKRIERRLDGVATVATRPGISSTSVMPNINALIKKLGGPIGAFNYALSQGDFTLAEALIPRLRAVTPHDKFIKAVLAQTAAMGSRVALEELDAELDNVLAYSEEERNPIIHAYVSSLERLDAEQKGLEKLRTFFDRVQKAEGAEAELTGKQKAEYLNLLQKLLHGTDQFDEAIRIGEQVIALCPDEPAYYYNLSIDYEQKEEMGKASEYMDKCLALQDGHPDVDDDHLKRAVEVYATCGDKPKCRRAYKLLQKINPLKAELVIADDDVQEILEG